MFPPRDDVPFPSFIVSLDPVGRRPTVAAVLSGFLENQSPFAAVALTDLLQLSVFLVAP